eukprot:TRINITY_DN622_c0_g1_i1.p2 TRINITY_DN622_c0_g1~~TRINITY_DN622_c0_g1_i1.p2  ORF type:complete len:107 (-),score=20.83 TRINITY_DN622_c0_g1_i1:29-313(-)
MQEALETLARGCAAFERERQQWAEEKARLMTELASARAMHRAQCDATKKLAERVALLQGCATHDFKLAHIAEIRRGVDCQFFDVTVLWYCHLPT